MELSQRAQKTLSRAFRNAANQSAQRLSNLFRQPWRTSAVRLGFNEIYSPPQSHNSADEGYVAAVASFPGGTTFISFPAKSLAMVSTTLFPCGQQRLQSMPTFQMEAMQEISNIILNQFVGTLADACQMGFVLDAPKHIPIPVGKRPGELFKKTLRSWTGTEWLIELNCPTLGAGCTIAVQLDAAMTSRMLDSLKLIYFSTFIDAFILEMSTFLVPLFALSLAASGTQIGWLNASPILMGLFAAYFGGQISDRFGRRPVLLFGAAVRTVSMLGTAFSHNLPLLFSSWTVDGAADGSMDAASAYISDLTLKNERFQKLTLFGVAIFLPSIIGPFIAGWLGKKGFSLAFFVCSFMAGLNLLILYARLPESRPSKATISGFGIFNFSTIKSLLSNRQIQLLVTISFIMQFSTQSIYQTLVLYSAQQLSYSVQQIGYFLSFIGLVSVVVRALMADRLVRGFGGVMVLAEGILLFCMGAGLMAYSRTYWAILGSTGLVGVGIPLIMSCLSVLLSLNATPDTQGAVFGLSSTCACLGAISGVLVAGLLYDRVSPTTPFLLVSTSLIVGFLFALKLEHKSDVLFT